MLPALCACSDSAGTPGGPESTAPTLETVSYVDTESVEALLTPLVGNVNTMTVSCGDVETATVETATTARMTVSVSLRSLDATRAVDRAAFTLIDILQRSATASAALRVDFEARRPAEDAQDRDMMISRTYMWDPQFDHPYDQPERRLDFIDVWRFTQPPPESMDRCAGSSDLLGRFTGIDAARVTSAANGDLPDLVQPVFPHGEYELRPNGLGFGFALPEQLTSFVVGNTYEAQCILGYSGTNGQGRPLYDLTLHLPHGSVLEFVVRDAVSGTEIVTRGDDEGANRDLVLSPQTGLAQPIEFSFPQAGRYEVFLRIAGGQDSARTKGVWIDVSDS